MMRTPAAQTKDVISFGPFSLVASERLLTRDGAPVELGARALDILIALVSRPNEIVSKNDLMAQVWPDVIVEEGSLRFHIAGLRKALGDGKDGRAIHRDPAGTRLLLRGADLAIERPEPTRAWQPHASFPHANLPSRLIRMVGRDDDVLKLSARLNATRFVTIVGSGGVGKTTVAVAVGHHLIEAFAGAVLFVDLGMLSDPDLVATAVASMLGLSVQSDDATPSLIAYLRDKRILLILDTCEHLIEAVAALASQIFTAAPQVHILATSREALQVEGEHVYRLEPLACPPDDAGAHGGHRADAFPRPSCSSNARWRAARASTSATPKPRSWSDICRKLDGVALAIELAARRVEAYGLQQTAALLDQRLTLLWLGPRTAPPRQKTLQATLDWSYGLLSEAERVVLRRLAIFVGHFTLDAALAVVTSATLDQVARFRRHRQPGRQVDGRDPPHRRDDALSAAGHDARLCARNQRSTTPSSPTWPCAMRPTTGDGWSRPGPNGRPCRTARNGRRTSPGSTTSARPWNGALAPTAIAGIGIGLAAAAAPVFLAMSLLPECHRWSERAMLALDDGDTRRSRGDASSGRPGDFVDAHARQKAKRRGRP